MSFVIEAPAYPIVPVVGGGEFPVRRIFCIAKNYQADARGPDDDPKTGFPPVFTKPGDAIHLGGDLPYPLSTENLHYEGELVVALKKGGTHLTDADLPNCIYGYAAGCDLTRRDWLDRVREVKGPWDLAKAFDDGAVIGPITPDSTVRLTGRVRTTIDGVVRQDGDLNQMIWSIPGMLKALSTTVELKAGDLIYTGTPAGIDEVKLGEETRIDIDGVEPVTFKLVAR